MNRRNFLKAAAVAPVTATAAIDVNDVQPTTHSQYFSLNVTGGIVVVDFNINNISFHDEPNILETYLAVADKLDTTEFIVHQCPFIKITQNIIGVVDGWTISHPERAVGGILKYEDMMTIVGVTNEKMVDRLETQYFIDHMELTMSSDGNFRIPNPIFTNEQEVELIAFNPNIRRYSKFKKVWLDNSIITWPCMV